MPGHDPLAIANEFLKLEGRPMNQMRLQKLVYIANGWNLAINGEPLTDARIEAWDGGPVYRAIWNHIRDFGYNVKSRYFGADGEKFKADLTEDEKNVIHHVWKRYGDYSGQKLSELTHQEGTPWSKAYFAYGRNSPVKQSDIRKHFTELALAGRS